MLHNSTFKIYQVIVTSTDGHYSSYYKILRLEEREIVLVSIQNRRNNTFILSRIIKL